MSEVSVLVCAHWRGVGRTLSYGHARCSFNADHEST